MGYKKEDSRKLARDRFWSQYARQTYTCPDCGRSRDQLRKRFEVHHKNGDPTDNGLSNLVALCQFCHNLRESKKPSLNEIEHMRNQFEAPESYFGTPTVPVVDSREEYNEYHEMCTEKYLPGLLVTTIPFRKYARVEFDFILASGWRILKKQKGPDTGLSTTLKDEKVDTVRRIVNKYKDRLAPSRSAHTLKVSKEPCFYTTPKMELAAARQLAYELEAVLHDRSNWRLLQPERYEEANIVTPETLS